MQPGLSRRPEHPNPSHLWAERRRRGSETAFPRGEREKEKVRAEAQEALQRVLRRQDRQTADGERRGGRRGRGGGQSKEKGTGGEGCGDECRYLNKKQ